MFFKFVNKHASEFEEETDVCYLKRFDVTDVTG